MSNEMSSKMKDEYPVSNTLIGRIVAKDLGVKSCSRSDANEVFDWFMEYTGRIKGVGMEIADTDAMNYIVSGL